MAQTQYNAAPDPAFEGMPVHGAYDEYNITRVNPNDGVSFGRAAVQGVNDDEFFVPTAGNGVFIGITMHTHDIEPSTLISPSFDAPATNPIPIKQKGRIWVRPTSDVTDLSDPVLYRFQNAAADDIGKFAASDGGAPADFATITSGAKWASTGLAGELVQLEVNLPA